ncbi:cytochrome P450 [Mycobacterium sp. DL592]|uniref:cytochrome P450 n=1 Tax=Mycobacterium sp. DL592 TaxID=2675524 RepID=UPI0014232F99|nr:cytochrome P450 [Mycobacterium sp. DL592]
MLDSPDPYPLYSWLRENQPVHQVGDSEFYLVSTWSLVNEVLARTEDFSSNLTATMVIDGAGARPFPLAGVGDTSHVLATADDPSHAAHRKSVLPSVVARRILALEPFISATAQRLWANAGADGSVDWVEAVSDRLPMIVVAQLLGFPAVDVDWLITGAYATTQMLDGVITAEQLDAAVAAAGALAEYLACEFARATADPRDDLLGDLARQRNSGLLDDQTCVLMLMQLVGAGGESTSGLLGNAAWLLATHPDIADTLRATPESLAMFVDEALRLESPFKGHYRHVVRDTRLGEVDLPADSHLLLLWGSANRDPDAFDSPELLLLDRPQGRNHLAFGKGTHFCIGAALARLEARVTLGMLLRESESITVTEPPTWVPSITIRRLQRLSLHIS